MVLLPNSSLVMLLRGPRVLSSTPACPGSLGQAFSDPHSPCPRLASPRPVFTVRRWVFPRTPDQSLLCALLMAGSLGYISWPRGQAGTAACEGGSLPQR